MIQKNHPLIHLLYNTTSINLYNSFEKWREDSVKIRHHIIRTIV